MRYLVFAALGCAVAFAQGIPRGKSCDGSAACADGLSCTKVAAGKRCERACDPKKKPACPEDQRCVKDGDANVCHPINDGVDL